MAPLVSIIIPVYNVEDRVRTCVSNVLAQTFCDYELLLVNDGSTDSSLEVCREIAKKDDRVIVVCQKKAGVSKARNTGLDHARGELIAFVDSDDLIAPDYLEYLLQGMENSDTVLSMCSYVYIYDYEYKFAKTSEAARIILARQCAERVLIGRFPIGVWGALFRKELIGDLRFHDRICVNEDKLFLYEYLLKNENGMVAYSNENRYAYYFCRALTARKLWEELQDIITVADRIRDITGNLHPEWSNNTQNACMSARFDVMKSILRSEESEQSKQKYKQLRNEVIAYGLPKTDSIRLKTEYLAVLLGKPAHRLLVDIYYRVYTENRRIALNKKRINQQ